MKSLKELVLVDGSGYIFRAYYALPSMTRSDGTPVNAVFGFTNMLLKLLEEVQREKGGNIGIAVIFDAARKTFRNEIYNDYKANRSEAPEDLIPQFDLIKKIPVVFNLPSIESLGFEADDLIASYAKKSLEKKIKVTVISSDKDLMQLLKYDINIFDPIKRKDIREEDVLKKFGVLPEKVIDVQALAGDQSDNIPGVPGIGVKTAALLINEYGNLQNLLDNCSNIKQLKRREKLEANKDLALISKKLVTLKEDVSLPIPIEDLAFNPLDINKLIKFLDQMEFSRIKSQVIAKFGDVDNKQLEIAAKNINSQNNLSNEQKNQRQNINKKTYKLILSKDELELWLKQINYNGVVAIDCETNSLSANEAEIVGFSLSLEDSKACYIPLNHKKSEQRIEGQISLEDFKILIKPIMEDASILKIGQNLKYDLIILNRIGIDLENYDDTMLMSYVLDAGKNGHGLDELSRIYLSHETVKYSSVIGKEKGKKTFDYVDFDLALEYAAEDADVTFRIWVLLKKRLLDEGLFSFYFYTEKPLVKVILTMELTGVKVDFNKLEKLIIKFESEINKVEEMIFKITNQKFNIGSPKQLGDILFDKMKLSHGKKGKSGNYQTDVGVLEKLSNEGVPITNLILKWRHYNKLKSTYCEGLISRRNRFTTRVHTSFGMASTNTGRLSSNDPNLQNIPIKTPEGKEIRSAFVSGKGKKIVSIDYSQIELRILAHVAKIDNLVQGFKNDDDIHSLTAMEVFQISKSELTNDHRRKAKTINFGIIYGISPFGLANQLNISNSEAKEYIEKYFRRYPGIRKYMNETIEFCRHNKFVKTAFGRKVFIPFINDKNALRRNFGERSAINAPIQGAAADMIKRSMIQVSKYLKKNNFHTKMILQVHDELIFEVPNDEISTTPFQIANIMENAYKPVIDFQVPLKADIGIGDSWADAH